MASRRERRRWRRKNRRDARQEARADRREARQLRRQTRVAGRNDPEVLKARLENRAETISAIGGLVGGLSPVGSALGGGDSSSELEIAPDSGESGGLGLSSNTILAIGAVLLLLLLMAFRRK